MIRQASIVALAKLSPDPAQAVSALVAALEDPHCLVRRAAASALGRLAEKASEALPALRKAADAPENAIPPDIDLLGDDQILILAGMQVNGWAMLESPVPVRERTVREAALEAIARIQPSSDP